MMNGRGFTGSGFNGSTIGDNARCVGQGFMNHGVGMAVVIGALLIIALLIFIFVHNSNKKVTKDSAVDVLKMKFVQGEITEEEYLKRKEVIGRK